MEGRVEGRGRDIKLTMEGKWEGQWQHFRPFRAGERWLVTNSDEGVGEWGSPFSIMKGKQETEW